MFKRPSVLRQPSLAGIGLWSFVGGMSALVLMSGFGLVPAAAAWSPPTPAESATAPPAAEPPAAAPTTAEPPATDWSWRNRAPIDPAAFHRRETDRRRRAEAGSVLRPAAQADAWFPAAPAAAPQTGAAPAADQSPDQGTDEATDEPATRVPPPGGEPPADGPVSDEPPADEPASDEPSEVEPPETEPAPVVQDDAYRRKKWAGLPPPRATLPPPLEPLPAEELTALRERLFATLRERAGEERLPRLRPLRGTTVVFWDCLNPYQALDEDGDDSNGRSQIGEANRPKAYAIAEQHLELAGVLLDSDDREVRESGLGVVMATLMTFGLNLDDGPLEADMAEVFLVPHFDSASPQGNSILSRRSLIGDAASAYKAGGRWERWGRACGDWIRLTPNNPNQADVMRINLYQALRNQGRIREAVDVLYDVHDLVPLRDYHLNVLFGAEDPDAGPRVNEPTGETVEDHDGRVWPVPQAPLPPPLEPLPAAEIGRLKQAVAATLRERAGEYRLIPIRPIPGRSVSDALTNHLSRLQAYRQESRPAEQYALLEQHLAWAGVLLDSDDRETRALGLGVISSVASYAGWRLKNGALAADVTEAFLLPDLQHASLNPFSNLDRRSLVGRAAHAFKAGGRWERWERACGEAIRLNPKNRNQSDVWRRNLYQALRNQGRIKEGVDVLYDIYDLTALRDHNLDELFKVPPEPADETSTDPTTPATDATE